MSVKDRLGSRRIAVVRLAPIIAVAVLVSGCDLINAALPGTGAVATPVQVEPSPLGTEPGSWSDVTLTNPALILEVPASWQQVSPSDTEAQLKAQLPSLTGDVAKSCAYEIQLIEQGQARDFFQGPSSDTNATDSIEIDVLTNDDSLPAGVAREDRADDAVFGAPSTRVESPVTLPIGPAILETSTSTPSGGAPSMSVLYVVRLDGRTVELLGFATADDVAFPGLLAHVAESLSQP